MGTETNAINRGSYCREASVGKVKYFSVYCLRFCVPCVPLPMSWVVPVHARFIFGDFCGFLNISSRILDDLILNLQHLPELGLLYNFQVILNYMSFPIKNDLHPIIQVPYWNVLDCNIRLDIGNSDGLKSWNNMLSSPRTVHLLIFALFQRYVTTAAVALSSSPKYVNYSWCY